MSYLALNTSATGLSAQNFNLDVIANNLANVSTVGFKGSRANFEDLLYVQLAQPNLPDDPLNPNPTGLAVGLGVKVSGTQLDTRQGPVEVTGGQLDILIQGEGFFIVNTPDGIGGGEAYTRAGNFALNADGQLVMANSPGYILSDLSPVPQGTQVVTIGSNGVVSVLVEGDIEPTEIGTIQLATFINSAGLASVGGNIYVQTAASGDPITGDPGEEGRGLLTQGALEQSNVDPVTELVDLIRTQRAFEMNSQVIQAANEMLVQIANLRRV